ncbi:hypothetical protein [Acidovorax sp. LjRoot117]|uniref:hypothetical protein n=1 Tax=Acidovorax sp. LjRoot117 TaxID=3342255 RepID=UPI003ECD1C0F
MIVVLESDSVRFSESKLSDSVFACIYLQYNVDQYFPECGWDDFAEVILEWWVDGAVSLLENGGSSVFRFMDGDFSFEIKMIGNKKSLIELRENSKILTTKDLDFMEFCQSLTVACNSLLRRTQEISKNKEIFSSLNARLNVLRNILKSSSLTLE